MAATTTKGRPAKAAGTKGNEDTKEGEAKLRGGLAQTVTPDAVLAAVIGPEPGTRADITRRIWEYVRANALQDAKDRRVIKADARLKPVFGGKESATMFEMTRLVSGHVK